MRYKLICLFLLLGFGANAQYLHMLERADSSSRKVVVTNNSGIQRYVEIDSLATLLGVNGSVDSLAIVQDTILVYFRSGSELGRDTIGTYNRNQIDSKDALRVLYTDTAAMLSPYITEVEVNDTLSVYYLSSQVDSADALRVLYTDTASMLSSYARRTELQDTASAIRSDLGADIGTKTDTTTFNALELVYNPNSQPILNKHYREVDKQTIYIEEINNAAQGVSRLLNTTLSSGRNAYQDAEVVWMADNSDSTVTYSNKGGDFTLSRNGNIYGKNNEGEWFEWMQDYPNIDFQENKQKAGLRLFSYIDYGFYRSRVEADTGTLYSIDTCTQNKIDMSLSSSITMIPDGAKAGKLYSIFPNDGSGDFSVTRATTATRVNAEGLIEEVAANVPRIDHTNGCPDLLIEPQRTNLVPTSEGTPQDVQNVTLTQNFGISPNGDSTSLKVLKDGFDGNDRIFVINSSTPISIVNGNEYTVSAFVKNIDVTGVTTIACRVIGGSLFRQGFQWSGSDLTTSGVAAAGSRTNVFLQDYGNGWWRIGFTFVADGTNTSYEIDVDRLNGTATTAIETWGWQIEEGSYATSYIPTEGTSVTRNADEIELTGAADLLGDSEGTLFVEASWLNSAEPVFLGLSDGSLNNRVYFYTSGSNLLFVVRVAATTECIIGGGTPIDSAFTKLVAAYKQDDFAFYQDGVQIGSDISGSVFTDGTLSRVGFDTGIIGSVPFFGRIRQLAIFSTRLTNTQLENITQ